MINSIKILFISVILILLQPLYADIIIGDGNIERLNEDVVKDINCQNYTILEGGLLDTSNGGVLREVTQLEIIGTWDFGSGQVVELGTWINNGTVAVKPTQTGTIQNLQFSAQCGPISVQGTSDTDGDGISDADEGDAAVALGYGISLDQDGDGIYNFLDDDSDNDDLLDSVEGGNENDLDGDGVPDYLDTDDSRPVNSDDNSTTGNTIGDDVQIDILANDTLEDGSVATAEDVNVTLIAPAGGTLNPDGSVTVPGEGTWSYDATTGVLIFSPESGFTGDPTQVEYLLTEIATGLTSEPAAVTVEYDDPSMSPVADDDISLGNILGEDVSIDILDGDMLGDGSAVFASDVNVTLIAPEGGALNTDGSVTVPGEGTWSYDETTGIVIFSPENDFAGQPTLIEYLLTELSTGLTDTASITVAYDVETKAVDDGVVIITHYGPNIIDVLQNDIFDGNVSIEIIVLPQYGTVEVAMGDDGNEVVIYTPAPDINHVPDSFVYSITDSNDIVSEATVTLDVQCASSQTSDGANALNNGTLMLMMMFTMIIGLYMIRREEEKGKEE